METHPDNYTIEEKKKTNNTILCYGYEEDLIQVYDFYCARYENITYKEFLKKGISDIQRKLASTQHIPVEGSYRNVYIRGMAVLVPDLPTNMAVLKETLR